jgi:hypothetical protein
MGKIDIEPKGFIVTYWKWILVAVVGVMLVTGFWNEIAGVPHVK